MDKDTILSEETFLDLLKETDMVLRTRNELALIEQAQALSVAKKFDTLLKVYKTSERTQSKQAVKQDLPNTQSDIRTQFHKFKDGKPIGVYDKTISNYVIKNNDIFVLGGIPYIYLNGVYVADENEVVLKGIIQKLLYEDIITIDLVNRVYRLILSDEKIQKNYTELNSYPKHWINFKNGFFNVIDWRIEEHKPEYFSVNQIPHIFDMEARCESEKIDAFIKYAVPNDSDKEMLFQYFGLCLTKDASIQKFLVLCGQAGTGKSILIRIIESIVGPKNISNISLQQLNERFFPSSLMGKLLNSCADIPSKALEAVDGIKKVTGEDMLIYEKKGKDAYSFKSYAKLLFSANEIPINIDEKSEAIYRRMMILRIDRKPEKTDPQLWDKLEPEVDYVIFKSMEALKRLYENGGVTESENSKLNVLELYESADNVLAFINDKLVKDTAKRVKQSDLFKSYVDYCNSTGRNPVTVFGFNKNLRNKGYSTVQIHGNTHYIGLGYKEVDFINVELNEDLPFL